MFTGIVRHLGTLSDRQHVGDDARLAVDVPPDLAGKTGTGDSVAVNGVCLTVTESEGNRLWFDVSAETLSATRLGDIDTGTPLNLEPALSAVDPMGGHFVTGHVDGLGEVLGVEPAGRSHRLEVDAPPPLARYIAEKGCITVDGVSLTVNDVNETRFGVNIVPHTWSVTNMKHYAVGARVHLEIDIIARYLERLLSGRETTVAEGDVTTDYLSKQGFAPPLTDAEQEEYENWQEAREDASD